MSGAGFGVLRCGVVKAMVSARRPESLNEGRFLSPFGTDGDYFCDCRPDDDAPGPPRCLASSCDVHLTTVRCRRAGSGDLQRVSRKWLSLNNTRGYARG